MRATLLESWPALAEFGINPTNFHLYSLPELEQYIDTLNERAWRARKRG